ncbi:MAG: hypothetical protein JST19_17395 [Bacteroidetes bacterium]|nr:hypothetical protein [Bacteroidota bacterium]
MEKTVIVKVISAILITLFIETAACQLLHYRSFAFQFGVSGVLKGYEATIGWAVPALEILAILLLLFPVTRITGLFASFLLMLLFTSYSAIMLASREKALFNNEGMLKGRFWKEHLIFNSFFLVIAGLGIYLHLERYE